MTIRVGLVGCGAIAPAHLRGWQRLDGFEIGGVFDLRRELAEQRSREFGGARIYDRIEQVIDDCEVVDVCTPPQTHAKIAHAVLDAGRHLMIEKPVVTDLAEWERLLAAIRRSSSKLAVIHNLKFAQSVRAAKAWVDEGRIGSVLRIQREFLTSPSTDRMLVGNRHWSHGLPGGRWFETMPHELYLTHWFAGPLQLAGVAVISTAHAPPGAPADEVAITLRGADTLATLHFSANCTSNRRVFTIQGSEGHIEVDILSDLASLVTVSDAKWRRAVGQPVLAAGQTLLRAVPDRSRKGWQHLRGESPHTRAIRTFGLHLRGLGEEPTPIDEVDYVVRNCDRIGRAIDTQLRELGRTPSSERQSA